MTRITGLPATGPEFSLVEGGPLRRLAQWVRFRGRPLGPVGLGVGLALVAWIPLLCLAALERLGPGQGVAVSFLGSVSTHVRFLVTLPLVFATEVWVNPRLRHFVGDAVDTRLVPEAEVPALERAIRLAHRLRDSATAELVLAILAIAFVQLGVRPFDLPDDVRSWRATGSGAGVQLTLAGWWYGLVALPLYQFVIGRWGWRLLVWWVFLWRFARLRLQLVPTHPDLAGGLGYLPVAQSHFDLLCFAFAAVAAGAYAEQMMYGGAPLKGFALPVLGLVLLNLALFLGPLLFFGPQLLRVKRRGLREYGRIATAYVRGFDAKWLRGGAPPAEPILGSGDIQSLNDLAGSFDVIRRMRVVPFGPGLVLILVAGTLAPMVPLLFLAFPLEDLLGLAAKLVLGV
jgi:hypothetical protein